jgi:hypothetical protein
VTPEGVEVPISSWSEDCRDRIAALSSDHKPSAVTGADPKWRFFWRIGERPPDVFFEDLNAAAVIPAAFPEWRETMDGWGESMLQVGYLGGGVKGCYSREDTGGGGAVRRWTGRERVCYL